MNSKSLFLYLTLALTLGTLVACGDDDDDDSATGEGTVNVKVYGEDYIEKGIPADEMDDGWAITFDKFDISIDELKVGGVKITTPDSLDIAGETDGSGHALASGTVPAGEHSGPGYSVNRIEMAGSATKDEVTKTFDLTFDAATHYSDCDTTTKVTDGGESNLELTIHADHLFGDSLVSHEPNVVFQALADADADDDGEITQAELEAADIGSYDPGSEGGVDNLWDFLVAQSQTLGHIDGEGHCDTHIHAIN